MSIIRVNDLPPDLNILFQSTYTLFSAKIYNWKVLLGIALLAYARKSQRKLNAPVTVTLSEWEFRRPSWESNTLALCITPLGLGGVHSVGPADLGDASRGPFFISVSIVSFMIAARTGSRSSRSSNPGKVLSLHNRISRQSWEKIINNSYSTIWQPYLLLWKSSIRKYMVALNSFVHPMKYPSQGWVFHWFIYSV